MASRMNTPCDSGWPRLCICQLGIIWGCELTGQSQPQESPGSRLFLYTDPCLLFWRVFLLDPRLVCFSSAQPECCHCFKKVKTLLLKSVCKHENPSPVFFPDGKNPAERCQVGVLWSHLCLGRTPCPLAGKPSLQLFLFVSPGPGAVTLDHPS